MPAASQKQIVDALLERHGRTYASEIGVDLSKNTPSPLFRWLCCSILLSARIGAEIAIEAARALSKKGWSSAQKMAGSAWEARARTLNEAGYARYDERTSSMLGDTSAMLLEKYEGDLRKLREAAGRDPGKERQLLKECKGLGDVGVDIFFREIQVAWEELYPFADRRALQAAGRLGLPDDAKGLARLVPRDDFPRLTAALVRTGLARDFDDIVERAAA
jgi:hypothetical protein